MIAGIITNGYCSPPSASSASTALGSSTCQISIDNVIPTTFPREPQGARQNCVCWPSTRFSREHQFGGWRRRPESPGRDRHRPARVGLGFTRRWGSYTMAAAVAAVARPGARVYMAMRSMEKSSYAQFNYFQDNIAHGKENDWRCRAARATSTSAKRPGAYCSQQRGYPQAAAGIHRRGHPPRVPHRQECAPRCTVVVSPVAYIDPGAGVKTWPRRRPMTAGARAGAASEMRSICPSTNQRLSKARPTSKARRAPATAHSASVNTTEFDPFLPAGHFRNDVPEDYLAGFPWHPHSRNRDRHLRLAGPWSTATSMGNHGPSPPATCRWMTAGAGSSTRRCRRRSRGQDARVPALGEPALGVEVTAPRYQEVKAREVPCDG